MNKGQYRRDFVEIGEEDVAKPQREASNRKDDTNDSKRTEIDSLNGRGKAFAVG